MIRLKLLQDLEDAVAELRHERDAARHVLRELVALRQRGNGTVDGWVEKWDAAWVVAYRLVNGRVETEAGHPGDPNPVTRAELHGEIARLHDEVEKLRATLRHPSSRTKGGAT